MYSGGGREQIKPLNKINGQWNRCWNHTPTNLSTKAAIPVKPSLSPGFQVSTLPLTPTQGSEAAFTATGALRNDSICKATTVEMKVMLANSQ